MAQCRDGTTRSSSALRAHRVDQDSAAAALGCDGGGGIGSGLQRGRQHYWDRARGTRTRLKAHVTRLGAWMRAGHGHGLAWVRTRSRQQEPGAVEWLRRGCRDPGH